MTKKASSRRKKAFLLYPVNYYQLTGANEDISLQENPASATITVTAVEVPELTEEE